MITPKPIQSTPAITNTARGSRVAAQQPRDGCAAFLGWTVWITLALGLAACFSGGSDDNSVDNEGPTADSGNPGIATQGVGSTALARTTAGIEEVRPFIATAANNLSTFAADVDSASFDLYRQALALGAQVDPASVRLEEYVNAFRYHYAAPVAEAAHPFAVSTEVSQSALYTTPVLRVGLQAKAPEAFVKRPTNLVFLVDVSGSMFAENKLPLVKTTLALALGRLDPEDTVSIVSYAAGANVRLEPTPVAHGDAIREAIDSLQAGGATAGQAGIELAYDQAEAAFRHDGINHVVMCTDGDFNVGMSSVTELVDLIVDKRNRGITLTVAGFGLSPNDAMMEAISNKGNGTYAVIYDEERAASYVEHELLASVRHVARDVKVQVVFNPAVAFAYRQLGYDNRQLSDESFRDDLVDAGEVGEGHQVTALYQWVRSEDALPSPQGAPPLSEEIGEQETLDTSSGLLARVRVRYKAPDALASDPATEFSVDVPVDEAAFALPGSLDQRWAVAISALAECLSLNPFYAAVDEAELLQELHTAQENSALRQSIAAETAVFSSCLGAEMAGL